MLLTTLATLGTLSTAQLPKTLDLPTALEGTAIEVTLQATTNHFAATNDSDSVQVLIVGLEGQAHSVVHLAPGTQVLYPFPRGAAEGVHVEVVALDSQGWRNTGAIPVDTLRASDQGAAWVQAGTENSLVWTSADERVAHVSPSSDLVPQIWHSAHPELTEFSAHVPVPAPTGDKGTKGTPVLNKKKLPPV